MQTTTSRSKSNRHRFPQNILSFLVVLMCLSILFTNTSCTMFLAKEGYKEFKKLEEEHKEKEEKKKQQEQQELSESDDDSTQPRHHGTWTPQQEE